MSILDVTEDQIFQTLGKGRDPNFKQIEKVRPVAVKPKKASTLTQTIRTNQSTKTVQDSAEPAEPVPSPYMDESMKKISTELSELNSRVNGIQRMVKWYIVPQFMVVVALLLALIVKS